MDKGRESLPIAHEKEKIPTYENRGSSAYEIKGSDRVLMVMTANHCPRNQGQKMAKSLILSYAVWVSLPLISGVHIITNGYGQGITQKQARNR
jgi:hypothetical protein